MRRSSGFTIVEIIVVLLLMSILAATLLGRSVTTTDLDLNSATDKVRNQLRFAQAEAMKRSDTVWGVNSSGAEYWLFRAIPQLTSQDSRRRLFRDRQPDQQSDLAAGVTLSDFYRCLLRPHRQALHGLYRRHQHSPGNRDAGHGVRRR